MTGVEAAADPAVAVRQVLRDALNQHDGTWGKTDAEADRLTALIADAVDLTACTPYAEPQWEYGNDWPAEPDLTPIVREDLEQARSWAVRVPTGGVVRRVPERVIPAGPWEPVPATEGAQA